MKCNFKKEKGVTMVALIITVLILLIMTNMLIYNAQDDIYVKKLTNLYNDISILREKVSAYYDEYGKIPAEIKYTNTSGLSSVLSTKNDTGDFYIIDLEAMQGVTLNYGKDYEKVKKDRENGNNDANIYNKYTNLYIINENSHNIFYVEGVEIKENGISKKYYTDYTEPDQTTIDLRYIDGILIPEDCYYIGKITDSSGNKSIVISDIQGDQYIWTKQVSRLEKIPDSITLEDNQKEYQFIESVNAYKGYFKNSEGKVKYILLDTEKWSEAYTTDTEYEDKNGDKIVIPQGFKVSMSPSMNIVENGFVTKDNEDNEWVWVVVPDSAFITAINNSDYENIKADLIRYAKGYRKGSSAQDLDWNDEWYDGCGISDSSTYTELYNKMLSSVYTNKGFWISRYEIGDETSTNNNYKVRTSNSGIEGKAVSKSNQVPYNYVTCSQAQKLASGMSTNINKTSSLLFGIQWDLTCKFLEENSELTYEDISKDSTNWGNYKNNSLRLVRGYYNINSSKSTSVWTPYITDTINYVTNKQTSNNGDYNQLLTTGASEETKKMNIYDLAGNEWEWTLEKAIYSTDNALCVYRGGNCYFEGSDSTVSFRDKNFNNYINNDVGLRVTLY